MTEFEVESMSEESELESDDSDVEVKFLLYLLAFFESSMYSSRNNFITFVFSFKRHMHAVI